MTAAIGVIFLIATVVLVCEFLRAMRDLDEQERRK